MLTLFSIPKAFKGHTAVIQTNAIKSWLELKPMCQVILIGDDEGTAEIAEELDVLHLPDVQRSESGTPLVSSIFALAQANAIHPLMCYVNADIILLNDFLPAIKRIAMRPLLMVGRRWDLDINELVDYSESDWELKQRERLVCDGKLHGPSGIDYFVYSKNIFGEIPPFAVGRTTWDNWLLYQAMKNGAAVIDASEVITIIHQNHDYNHTLAGADGVWKGPEARRNLALAGNGRHTLSLEHATWRMMSNKLERTRNFRDLYFHFDAMVRLSPYLGFLWRFQWALLKIVARISFALKRK